MGRGLPEESAIAYGALADTLRLARRAEPQVWESARALAGVVRAVTPEIGEADERGAARIARWCSRRCWRWSRKPRTGTRRLLWVLDGVHWADDATWHFVGTRRAGWRI